MTCATLMYTGGTTGRAKGVMLSHRKPVCMLPQLARGLAGRGDHRALTPLPLSHAYGMIVTLIGVPRHRARAWPCSMRWFDPAELLALAAAAPDPGARRWCPAMIADAAARSRWRTYDLSVAPLRELRRRSARGGDPGAVGAAGSQLPDAWRVTGAPSLAR